MRLLQVGIAGHDYFNILRRHFHQPYIYGLQGPDDTAGSLLANNLISRAT